MAMRATAVVKLKETPEKPMFASNERHHVKIQGSAFDSGGMGALMVAHDRRIEVVNG